MVEKLISVYAKEVKTDNVKSPDEFIIMVDEALTKFPNNQNMPLYKAIVLMSLGKKDEALEYYKKLILKSPSKCYLWNQASELVEEVDLKIALLCKAISVERDESFIGGCRLNLAKALIEKNMMANAKYELDERPIEEGCQCPSCRTYSRAYIRHLLKAKEMSGMRLCVLHNLYFYNTMMEEIREAIEQGRYKEYKEEKLAKMSGK